MRIRSIALPMLFAAGSALAPSLALAHTHRMVLYVNSAPPVQRVEVVPAARPGHVWSRGHWVWRNHHYVWVRGHWVRARYGYRWSHPHWAAHYNRWHYVPGHWARG